MRAGRGRSSAGGSSSGGCISCSLARVVAICRSHDRGSAGVSHIRPGSRVINSAGKPLSEPLVDATYRGAGTSAASRSCSVRASRSTQRRRSATSPRVQRFSTSCRTSPLYSRSKQVHRRRDAARYRSATQYTRAPIHRVLGPSKHLSRGGVAHRGHLPTIASDMERSPDAERLARCVVLQLHEHHDRVDNSNGHASVILLGPPALLAEFGSLR